MAGHACPGRSAAPLCKHVPTFAISQRCGTRPAPASRLANPKLVCKKRLQFHKEISYVRISFAHEPHDQENLVTEVKCGSAQAPVIARLACLSNRGLWLKLFITNAEQTEYQVATIAANAHRLKRREVFVHAQHPSANITQALVTAVALCFSSQIIRGQVGAQTRTFVIHGTPRTCSAITQLDSALSADYQQFFAGWTEKDYVDAVAWSQACSEYGWHNPGRPRIPLLLAQHERALGSAQTQNTATSAA